MKYQNFSRAERVAEQVRDIVANSCLFELSDSRLKGAQITRASLTKDLQIARIYFHLVDPTEENKKKVFKGLRSATGYFKKEIGRELNLKYMPQFEFFYDEGVDHENRIHELLNEIGVSSEELEENV